MKLKTTFFISILLILSIFVVGAEAEVSKYEAGKLTDEYVFENEVSVTYGPYTYEEMIILLQN